MKQNAHKTKGLAGRRMAKFQAGLPKPAKTVMPTKPPRQRARWQLVAMAWARELWARLRGKIGTGPGRVVTIPNLRYYFIDSAGAVRSMRPQERMSKKARARVKWPAKKEAYLRHLEESCSYLYARMRQIEDYIEDERKAFDGGTWKFETANEANLKAATMRPRLTRRAIQELREQGTAEQPA